MNHALELKVQPIQGRTDARILQFIGEFDASAVEQALEEVTSLLDAGVKHLVCDCQELRYVNSTGLGVLLHFSRVTRERGGSFRLCTVSEPVYEIIEIIGATTLLELHESVQEAIASLT